MKEDDEEEVVVNDACNNGEEQEDDRVLQEHGRVIMVDNVDGDRMVNQNRNHGAGYKKAALDDNSTQERIPCSQDNGRVVNGGESMSTGKMAVVNPGPADTTPYALR